ncbi:unnamed protein product [Pieris macdunnoughi]|nr:unnamed protein product [Pieris macdunnoughi]
MHILQLLFNVLFNPKTPSYLKQNFMFLSGGSFDLRSLDNLILETPIHKTEFYHSSFTVQSILLWNSLPIDIRRAQSLNLFKKLLLDHFLSAS